MGGWGVFRTLVDGFEWVLWRWEGASVHSPFVCPSPTPVLFSTFLLFFLFGCNSSEFSHIYSLMPSPQQDTEQSITHKTPCVPHLQSHPNLWQPRIYSPSPSFFFSQNILALFPVSGGKHSLSIYFRAYLMVKDSLSFPSLRIFLFHLHSWKNVFTR